MARRKSTQRGTLEQMRRLGAVRPRGANTVAKRSWEYRPDVHEVVVRALAEGYSIKSGETGTVPGGAVLRGLRVYLRKPIKNKDVDRVIYDKVVGPPDANYLASISLLSSPAKMAAPGFNMPAGPPALGGTCAGSAPGFPGLSASQRKRVRMSPAAKEVGVRPQDWLCSGCYALKSNYAYSNLQVGLDLRRLVALDLMARGEFVEVFERAIVADQLYRVTRIAELYAAGREDDAWMWGDPSFFRLHDSGDFPTPDYMAAWFELARKFERGRVVRARKVDVPLPPVHFWAPTRVWAVAGKGFEAALRRKPDNFTVRPSALHFGDPAPELTHLGYDLGSAVATYGERHKKVAGWECPATMDPVSAARGVVAPRPNGVSLYERGACNTSRGYDYAGPSSPGDAAPFGRGCRTCWLYPAVSVGYHEH